MTRDLGQAPDRPGEAGGRGETDEARGPSPGRQARKPHRRLGDGAGVPHSQPANRPPRHGMGKPEAGHPEGLGLPRAPADPRPALSPPQPRAAPRARASQQPRRRQHHSRHLVSPPTASVVTSCSAPGTPPPRRPLEAFGLALPVRGAEAAARGSERWPSGGRRRQATRAAAGTEPGPWSRRCRAEKGRRRGARGDGGLRAPPGRHPAVPGPEPRHSGR